MVKTARRHEEPRADGAVSAEHSARTAGTLVNFEQCSFYSSRSSRTSGRQFHFLLAICLSFGIF